jgi:hypothetical protein
LKDLCARLPYRVTVKIYDEDILLYDSEGILDGKETMSDDNFVIKCDEDSWIIACDGFKPYLRPLSSMTEEEDKEYTEVIVKSQDCSYEHNESATTVVNDWYLSKGFDVRGLIPRGLALEATEGMYEIQD